MPKLSTLKCWMPQLHRDWTIKCWIPHIWVYVPKSYTDGGHVYTIPDLHMSESCTGGHNELWDVEEYWA